MEHDFSKKCGAFLFKKKKKKIPLFFSRPPLNGGDWIYDMKLSFHWSTEITIETTPVGLGVAKKSSTFFARKKMQ